MTKRVMKIYSILLFLSVLTGGLGWAQQCSEDQVARLSPAIVGGGVPAAAGGTSIISENTTGDYTGDYTGVVDAGASGGANAGLNFGTSSTINISASAGNTPSTHPFIKFTGLTNLSGQTVTAVTLGLYMSEVGGSASARTINVRRLLRDWAVGTGSGNPATWDTPDSSCWTYYGGADQTANPWSTAGAYSNAEDRSDTLSATKSLPAATGWFTISSSDASCSQMVADVQGWIDGTFDNYGWIVFQYDASSTTSDWWVVNLSQKVDGTRPYLSVTY